MSVRTLSKRAQEAALLEIEEALEAAFKRETQGPIEIGRLLIRAKEMHAAHGEWLTWLGFHFPHAVRTSQNYMASAKLADKYATVAHLRLAPGALYKLAAIDGNDANCNDGIEIIKRALCEAEIEWVDGDRVDRIKEEVALERRPPPPATPDDTPLGRRLRHGPTTIGRRLRRRLDSCRSKRACFRISTTPPPLSKTWRPERRQASLRPAPFPLSWSRSSISFSKSLKKS